MALKFLHSNRARKRPLTALQLKAVERWLAADWESADVDRDMVRLITRLIATVRALEKE